MTEDASFIKRKRFKEFLGFVSVSLSATAIELLLFDLTVDRLELFFPVMYITVATFSARAISDLYKYLLDRKVFKAETGVGSGLMRFIVLALAKVNLSALFVTMITMASDGDETLIKMAVDVTIFFPAYIIEKKWVHQA